MKKLLSIVLVLSIVMAFPALSYAARGSDSFYDGPTVLEAAYSSKNLADLMYIAGMVKGTGLDESGNPKYELERRPTRAEALVMLIRLLGKEEQALSASFAAPFTDVPAWAAPYVGYAYYNGITKGMSDTVFGASNYITAQQYATFMMRALGLSEEKGDFTYKTALSAFSKLGGTLYTAEPAVFTRGSMMDMSANTLMLNKGSTGMALIRALNKGFVTKTGFFKVNGGSALSFSFTDFLGENETKAPLNEEWLAYACTDPSDTGSHMSVPEIVKALYKSAKAGAGAEDQTTVPRINTLENYPVPIAMLDAGQTEFDYYILIGEENVWYLGFYPAMGSMLFEHTADEAIDENVIFFDISEYIKGIK